MKRNKPKQVKNAEKRLREQGYFWTNGIDLMDAARENGDISSEVEIVLTWIMNR